MIRPRKRKCRCCHDFYVPDYRILRRQKYCGKADCQRASKAASQRRWLSKPGNREYFRGPVHVERKRRWRAEHPQRARQGSAKPKKVPQEMMVAEVAGTTSESGNLGQLAPQDMMTSQSLVLVGLIAKLTDSTSQDEIAKASLSLIRLGQDVMAGGGKGGKACVVLGATAAGAAAI
jgi:hypothetical protein